MARRVESYSANFPDKKRKEKKKKEKKKRKSGDLKIKVQTRKLETERIQ